MNTNSTPSADFDLEFEEATAVPDKAPQTKGEVPEKYKGKDISAVIEMHQNLEHKLSSMGNELGQVRKLADTLLEMKKENVEEPKPRKPLTVDEIFADPDQAINATVASSDVAKDARDAKTRVDNIERQLALQKFENEYPDYRKDLSDPTFQNWVVANPARQELFRRADNYDTTSANALWQMWDEYRELREVSEKKEEAKTRRKKTIEAGKTVSEGSADVATRAPIYSRAKLMELRIKAEQGDLSARSKMNDPAFQEEMTKAYAEGRVR